MWEDVTQPAATTDDVIVDFLTQAQNVGTREKGCGRLPMPGKLSDIVNSTT